MAVPPPAALTVGEFPIQAWVCLVTTGTATAAPTAAVPPTAMLPATTLRPSVSSALTRTLPPASMRAPLTRSIRDVGLGRDRDHRHGGVDVDGGRAAESAAGRDRQDFLARLGVDGDVGERFEIGAGTDRCTGVLVEDDDVDTGADTGGTADGEGAGDVADAGVVDGAQHDRLTGLGAGVVPLTVVPRPIWACVTCVVVLTMTEPATPAVPAPPPPIARRKISLVVVGVVLGGVDLEATGAQRPQVGVGGDVRVVRADVGLDRRVLDEDDSRDTDAGAVADRHTTGVQLDVRDVGSADGHVAAGMDRRRSADRRADRRPDRGGRDRHDDAGGDADTGRGTERCGDREDVVLRGGGDRDIAAEVGVGAGTELGDDDARHDVDHDRDADAGVTDGRTDPAGPAGQLTVSEAVIDSDWPGVSAR